MARVESTPGRSKLEDSSAELAAAEGNTPAGSKVRKNNWFMNASFSDGTFDIPVVGDCLRCLVMQLFCCICLQNALKAKPSRTPLS